MNSRILVTGGAGFIGSHLVDRLIERGEEVLVIDDLSSGKTENLERWFGEKKFKFIKADLSEPGKWIDELKGIEAVFHFAANPEVRVSTTNPEVHYRANVQATFNVLEASRANGAEIFIYASSSTVYGEARVIPTPEDYEPKEPISIYGASKLMGEVLVSTYSRIYGVKSAMLRFANVVGKRSNHGVIFDFIAKLKRDPERLEILGDGKQRKSYIYIDDAIEATLKVMEHMESSQEMSEAFNVGSLDAIGVDDIAYIIEEEMGLGKVEHVFKSATHDGRGWIGDVKVMQLDVSKIMGKTNWKPKMNSREAVRKATKDLLERMEL
ncbi:NAD-dependent epimerase/dehydratase family protein [Fervidicoccus fontis]|uniref:NAD-dependent epimerase/dehydratase n=1 Tax=Fervidicoccus fontis (strain DSM 19380 / JCM 18336 / VKM B-2539 / Kam940) TaxID=1163730 RepID=I0A0W1_FERFK|nr:NAD-dependent epimerase/dehydratase family protein [Fervidicoccus fontis]AFH42618.1 NAD-dependent epimerase/dehydratase [Fervidicoccus fontis Kam940]